jgi:putative hemolysin
MGPGVEVAVIVLLILLNGFFALSEMALVSVRQARLALLERKGTPGAAAAHKLSAEPHQFLPTLQVGLTLVSVLAGVFGGARIASHVQIWLELLPPLAPLAEPAALGITVVLITYFTIVLGELVPKQLALRHPEHIAAMVARTVVVFAWIAAPVVWLLNVSSALVLRLGGVRRAAQRTVTEEELKALLAEGAQTGVLELEERDMMVRVLRLADKPVRAIMTPRTELVWIDPADSPADIAAALKNAPYSRIVVCDGAVDNVTGVVQAKDLLQQVLNGGEFSIAAVLRQPMVMPDTVSALDALEPLRTDPFGLALVMDEYGSFEGVVTAADVLGAITGDRWHDGGEGEPAGDSGADGEASGGPMLLDGMMPVDELKARLNLPDLPAEGDYHTAGGLVLALMRRVPKAGDRIVFAGWRFEVLAMDGRRVDRLQASREKAEAGAEA